MHELSYKPPDYSSSKGTPLFPFRPSEASFSQPAKESLYLRAGSLGRVASFAPMYRACHCGGRAIRVSDRCFRALQA